jgi:uncharacterized protein with von Willebrand factor type A (vWA) domain
VSFFPRNLIAFGRLLRRFGLAVDPGRVRDAVTALEHVDLGSRPDVQAALRSLLVQRHEDFAAFDKAFDMFFSSAPRVQALPEPRENAVPDSSVSAIAIVRTWSDTETIADKDFAALTDEEQALARQALQRIDWKMAERRTRRWEPGRGRRIDLRRAMTQSLRTGGEITTLPRRTRKTKPRPMVLLGDVSGSMERYTRTLLIFAHALSRSRQRVEAFLFATRLTRVTPALRSPRPDAAIAAVSRTVRDWSGGTRIGEALRDFNRRWRRRTLHGGPIVLLISDGWDRGEPAMLRDEVARLQRSCHRLVWLNPLIGTIDYAPLTRGLEAALPYVDDFLPVRTLRDVRELALHLSALNQHGHHRLLHLRRTARPGVEPAHGSGGDRVMHPRM